MPLPAPTTHERRGCQAANQQKNCQTLDEILPYKRRPAAVDRRRTAPTNLNDGAGQS